jgi:hypothetical protein
MREQRTVQRGELVVQLVQKVHQKLLRVLVVVVVVVVSNNERGPGPCVRDKSYWVDIPAAGNS